MFSGILANSATKEPQQMKTVAIIGGGFSGTMTAVNLARLAKAPLRIVLINKGSPLGRGAAYGTKQSEHLLNVVARNMSAFPDQPNHFLEWLGTRAEYADVPETALRDQFMPRRTYGDYLHSLLFWHAKGLAKPNVQIETIDKEVLDLVPGPDRIAVIVAGHATIEADKVVLATGNPPPADLPFSAGFEHPRLIGNPWRPVDYAQTDPRENVILIGAGLTMIDVFLTLTALKWQGTLYAVSRTGLLPQPHFHGIAYGDFPPADPTTLDFDGLLKLMEHHCRLLRDQGENPAIVVDKLRPFTQRVWQSLSVAEKTRFVRDYRTRWNVLRHRVAQSIHAQNRRRAQVRQVAARARKNPRADQRRRALPVVGRKKIQRASNTGSRLGHQLHRPAGKLQERQSAALRKPL